MEDSTGDLARGREHYRLKAWAEAYASLTRADGLSPLGAEDLELLAVSAYLVGRDGQYLDALDRAYRAHLAAARSTRAARCAFWIGLRFLLRGEAGRATAWHALVSANDLLIARASAARTPDPPGLAAQCHLR